MKLIEIIQKQNRIFEAIKIHQMIHRAEQYRECMSRGINIEYRTQTTDIAVQNC
jgi:hypothetical protein